MVCRGRRIALYSLNGALLLDQDICETNEDGIVSCAFYEGAGNEWLERELLFTGHKRGLVNVSFLMTYKRRSQIRNLADDLGWGLLGLEQSRPKWTV
jgi:hypothetical protein